MTRQLLYVAQAFAIELRANIDRAMHWLNWLRVSFPETTFIAPWIASILAGADDSDPAQREAGMRDNEAVIERCDGIVLCGGRISEGMRREMEHGVKARMMVPHPEWQAAGWQPTGDRFAAYDLTWMGSEPPPGDGFGSYIGGKLFKIDGRPFGKVFAGPR